MDKVDLLLRIRGDDANDAELADLSRELRDSLLALDIDDARPLTAGAPPPGAKAGEALTLGALLITLAPVLIGGVVDVAVSWLRRQPDTVELTIGGQKFRGRVTRAQRDALVAALISQATRDVEHT